MQFLFWCFCYQYNMDSHSSICYHSLENLQVSNSNIRSLDTGNTLVARDLLSG